jgi:peroxiredoxin
LLPDRRSESRGEEAREVTRDYGKTYMGVECSTLVIDADGNVATVLRKVKPATHAADVLAALAP